MIPNERHIREYHLKRFAVWQALFMHEADRLSAADAATLLDVTQDDFLWIRAIALGTAPSMREAAQKLNQINQSGDAT